MSRKTIFDFGPLSNDEQAFLLAPIGSFITEIRRAKGVPFEHIGDLLTKEEYPLDRSEKEKYYDLFCLFRHRGDFEMAKKYEVLSNHDEVKEFENIPRDLFIKNELEYYEWRKKNP